MKAIIIGGSGFVGGYLIDHLLECGWSVTASKLPRESIVETGCAVRNLDILKRDEIVSVLDELRPDCVFHLAAQSSVALSWEKPELTTETNIIGAVNVLESLRSLDYHPRVLMIGSGEEYGLIRPQDVPVNEEAPLRPGNIYAATKACQNFYGRIYAHAYGLDIVMARAFNHIGPGQSPSFVVSNFCKQVADIEANRQEAVIQVGNLSAKREFTHVKDIVSAYKLLITNGVRGETYNVGNGHAVTIEWVLHKILSMSEVQISVEVDEARYRPVDVPVIEADVSKIQELGWSAVIKLSDALRETLDYWRRTNSKL